MKRYYSLFIVISFLSLSFLSFKSTENKIGNMLSKAMENPANENFVVWVYFKDKGPNAMAKLNNPLSIVTQRSLDRRSKVKPAGELLDYTDIPLYSGYVNSVAAGVMKVRHQIKWLNCMSVEVNRSQVNAISNLDHVKGIELVEKFRRIPENPEISSDVSPVFINPTDDPLADTLTYGTGNAVTQITQIKVNLVHNQGIKGQGIMIASFDAGFSNLTHEAFTTYPMKIQTTYDFQNHTPTLTG
ncbi:MAG TPA: hypothetical protein VG961_14225, partial [Ignavibacteria bacterium]|nr:hypothetical protein [Ignavibacteria bacterium]